MKPGKTGLTRLLHAARYSWDGLIAGFQSEAAIRQELALLAVGTILAAWLPFDAGWRLACIGVLILLLIVELLNSAVEAVVDLASPALHDLAKRAKDLGSAAVLVTVMLTLGVWGTALWQLRLH